MQYLHKETKISASYSLQQRKLAVRLSMWISQAGKPVRRLLSGCMTLGVFMERGRSLPGNSPTGRPPKTTHLLPVGIDSCFQSTTNVMPNKQLTQTDGEDVSG